MKWVKRLLNLPMILILRDKKKKLGIEVGLRKKRLWLICELEPKSHPFKEISELEKALENLKDIQDRIDAMWGK